MSATWSCVRFRFESGDDQYNGFRGWFVDDVSVDDSVFAGPVINAIAPQTVNPGMVVTVLGANFVNGAVLQVDSAQVPSAVMSSSVATFLAPAAPAGGTSGFVSLRVTNPDGKTIFIPRALNIVTTPPPSIVTITPDSAAVGTSVQITITGANFATGTTVDIGGIPATGVVIQSATSLQATTPATLPEGSYNVRVVNLTGLSDIHVLGFKVFTPSIKVDPVGDPSVGKTVGLNITPPAGTTFTTGVLYFRQGGRQAYDSLALQSVTGGYRGFFPPAVMTIRGVEYWVRLSSLQGLTMTYPLSFPAFNPAIFQVKIPQFIVPLGLLPAKYRMISAPMLLDNPYLQQQLADDFGDYSSTVWRSFRFFRNGYIEATPATTVEPGYAHWLISATGTSFSFNGGVSMPTGSPQYLEVDTGWTMIGNPFGFPVHWLSVGGASGVFGPYAYDGSQYRIDTALVPFEGYFIRNDFNPQLVLQVPPIDASLYRPGKVSAASRALAKGDFALRVAAEIPATEYRDTYNYVGFRSDALAGRDRYDAPKPPAIGEGLRLTILDDGRGYLENFKPAAGEGQSWIVVHPRGGCERRRHGQPHAAGRSSSGFRNPRGQPDRRERRRVERGRVRGEPPGGGNREILQDHDRDSRLRREGKQGNPAAADRLRAGTELSESVQSGDDDPLHAGEEIPRHDRNLQRARPAGEVARARDGDDRVARDPVERNE